MSSKAPTADMQKTVTHLREQLAERNMVGDIRSAEARWTLGDTDRRAGKG
ncbi:hypothetical protein NicSoilC12_30490 [Arthrobacter sp. NicSoilC12]|nr:hypothetical protein NicSoilC12_30490 [Arthrobacter sp. NicSoilC12]